MNEAVKPPDGVERKQLADEAKWLIENKAFAAAILALRKQWYAELVETDNERVADRLRYQLRALESIPQQLQILINDQTMHAARHR